MRNKGKDEVQNEAKAKEICQTKSLPVREISILNTLWPSVGAGEGTVTNISPV